MNFTMMNCGSDWRTTVATSEFKRRLTVTVASSPSGTFATMMPMRKMMESRILYRIETDIMKKTTPTEMATPATR